MKDAYLFKTLSTIYDEFFLLKELTTLTLLIFKFCLTILGRYVL